MLCMYFGYFVDLVMEKKTPLERFHLEGYIGSPYSYLKGHPAFEPQFEPPKPCFIPNLNVSI